MKSSRMSRGFGSYRLVSLASLVVVSVVASCTSPGAPPQVAGSQAVSGPGGQAPASPVAGTSDSGSAVIAVNAGRCPAVSLLDDAEDGDSQIVVADQRNGRWYTFGDQAGSTIEPAVGKPFQMAEGGARGSRWAARMHGRTAPEGKVQVGMGFTFTEPSQAYDISCCQGISFWAKKSKESVDVVRVKIGDANTLPEGQVCHECFNDFGLTLGLRDEWQKFELPFDRMKQLPYWGDQFDRLEASKVFKIEWQIAYPGYEYDFWVDEIELFGCQKSG